MGMSGWDRITQVSEVGEVEERVAKALKGFEPNDGVLLANLQGINTRAFHIAVMVLITPRAQEECHLQ